MVLHKKEIVDKIAEKTGLKKQDIKWMYEAFREIIYEELAKGNSVLLRKLFTIMPTVRTGNKYNINTKEVEYKDEYVSVKTVPSKALKEYVRGKAKLSKKDKQRAYEKQMAALQEKLRMWDEELEEN